MAERKVQMTAKYLQDLAKGAMGHEFEPLVLGTIEITEIRPGFVRCKLAVTSQVSDGDGNWHVGAIAAMMDTVGATAVYSSDDGIFVSLDFNVSYYSPARTQEEIEVEAKVVGINRRLKSAVIEVRSSNGEIIALGRLWMAPLNINAIKNLSPLSKL